MLKGFEHVGMTCSNMDRTIGFYCGLLGLKLVLRKAQAKGGEIAFLDAGGGMLEIFSRNEPVMPAQSLPANQAGVRHITFAFDDIEQTCEGMAAAGVTFTEKPRAAFHAEMLRKVAFCLDPDGIVVELVERSTGRDA
jgi:glyoxylase I family protein